MSDDVAPTSVQRQSSKITTMAAIPSAKLECTLDSEWPEHSMRILTEPIAPRPMNALAIGRENGTVAIYHETSGNILEVYEPPTSDGTSLLHTNLCSNLAGNFPNFLSLFSVWVRAGFFEISVNWFFKKSGTWFSGFAI